MKGIMKLIDIFFIFLIIVILNACGDSSNSHTTTDPPKVTEEVYVFQKLVGPDIWVDLANTMAVDSTDSVYLTSGTTVFKVIEGIPEIYISFQTILSALGGAAYYDLLDIGSLDVGPDDRLYLLERNSRRILVSDGPENVAIHRDLTDIPGFSWLIGVENSDYIFLINLYDGLWSIKLSGNTLLYDNSQVLGGTNCGSESFAVNYNGYFAYIPGCNPTPLIGGPLDGTGAGILANEDDFDINNNLSFSSVTRDPEGGYMVALFGSNKGPIAHISDNGDWRYLLLEPDLAAIGLEMEGFEYVLNQRPIAVGPSGRIYACSSTTLYVANKIIREVNDH